MGSRGFQAADAHCRSGLRSKDTEKEERFPARTFGISYVRRAFFMVKSKVGVYMFPFENRQVPRVQALPNA